MRDGSGGTASSRASSSPPPLPDGIPPLPPPLADRVPPLAPPPAHAARLEASRKKLLAAIGQPPDLTFIRGVGNLGDELIWAGTRRLLASFTYREVGLEEVAKISGHTALLTGGGAWCRPYHEILPHILPLAELRFARVVVLPSSFDLAAEPVRDALSRTRALVFARELDSYRQIRGVCLAALAHDASFFFDFSPYRGHGAGTLAACRTDHEAAGHELPAGNTDISRTCGSLDCWLWTISRHARVHTDRAHVMIAAALLGKQVEFRPSSYHKVPAIARYALRDFAVRQADQGSRARARPGGPLAAAASPPVSSDGLEPLRGRLLAKAREGLSSLPAELIEGGGEPRSTIVIVCWNRPRQALAALRALREFVRIPCKLLVIDNNSAPAARAELRRALGEHRGARLVELDRNLGCAGARQLSLSHVDTEYVIFLDDDLEVFPGTIEHLVHALDCDPAALAAGAHVVLPDGRTQFCGGDYREEGGMLRCEPLGHGLRFDDPAHVAPRLCRWLGGAAAIFRKSALDRHPFDLGMAAYFEDNEWFYRVGRAEPAVFRSSAAALALHHQELKARQGAPPFDVIAALPFIESIAHFYAVHGLVLDGLFVFVPELAAAGPREVAAARILLELLNARGRDWLLLRWLDGSLAPLFQGDLEPLVAACQQRLAASEQELSARSHQLAASDRQMADCARRLAAADDELRTIHGSRLWRAAHAYWSLRRQWAAVSSRLAGMARRVSRARPGGTVGQSR